MAPLTVTLLVEPDQIMGELVQHVFPSFEPHEARTGCGCRPALMGTYSTGHDIKAVQLYWHRWRHEQERR